MADAALVVVVLVVDGDVSVSIEQRHEEEPWVVVVVVVVVVLPGEPFFLLWLVKVGGVWSSSKVWWRWGASSLWFLVGKAAHAGWCHAPPRADLERYFFAFSCLLLVVLMCVCVCVCRREFGVVVDKVTRQKYVHYFP